jgi:hypothetical protein
MGLIASPVFEYHIQSLLACFPPLKQPQEVGGSSQSVEVDEPSASKCGKSPSLSAFWSSSDSSSFPQSIRREKHAGKTGTRTVGL